jgi:TetR/AcrR family transcriptional regulator, transcriptional repressor for nem operon
MDAESRSGSRERILAVAQQLFHAHGYGPVSLDRIVAGAGVTKGSFYYHFESKEALALEVLDWYRRKGAEALDYAGLEAMPSPVAAIEVLVERLLTRGHTRIGETAVCGCFFGNFALELSAASEAVRAKVADVLEGVRLRLRLFVERAQSIGEISAQRNADALASALLALVEGTILLDKAEQGDRHATAALSGVRDLLRT